MSTEIRQIYLFDFILKDSIANRISTNIATFGSSVYQYYTFLNTNNGQAGLTFDENGGNMQHSISTNEFESTITSSSHNASSGSFQVQVYILVKKQFHHLTEVTLL
jgi:hypothetical protein